jgi:metallo-beta-lactamase family protein
MLRIHGKEYELNAQVVVMNEFSAHAGRADLLAFGERFKDSAEKILLVHGEVPALEALKAGLQERGVTQVALQQEGETLEL